MTDNVSWALWYQLIQLEYALRFRNWKQPTGFILDCLRSVWLEHRQLQPLAIIICCSESGKHSCIGFERGIKGRIECEEINSYSLHGRTELLARSWTSQRYVKNL